MPAGFATGLSTSFAYVTVEQVRDAGIPDSGDGGIADGPLRELIRLVSHWINQLTDQWFMPVRLREKTDGADGSIARIPNLIPILELFHLTFEKQGLFSIDLPDVAYQVKQRYVSLLDWRARLPGMPHFVVLDGVFGWLVDDYVKAKTTLTAALDVTPADVDAGTKTATVASTSGIAVRDTVLFGNDPEPQSYPAIVIGVPDATTIEFAPIVPFSLPAGVRASRYGRIPDLIVHCAMLLIRDKILNGWGKIGYWDVSDAPFGIGTRLTSESVEGYSYSLTPMKVINGPGGGERTTGNAEADDILSQYTWNAGGGFYVGLA
jgi:hypothetical protein